MRSTLSRRAAACTLLTFVLAILATAVEAAESQKRRPSVGSTPSQAPAPTTEARSASRQERPVPFRPGERLTYDVSWSSFVTAGEATLTVREKKPSYSSTAYYIVGEGRPTGIVAGLYALYYKADTLLDVYTLLPQRGSVFSQEGKRHRLKVTRFEQQTRSADYEVRTASVARRTLSVPAAVQDALSAVYVLRAVQLKEGDRFTMPVCDGGSTYRVMWRVGKREPVRTAIGTLTAFPITPTMYDAQRKPVGPPMTVWVSDDARRLPLKLQASLSVGSFVFSLREAK